MKWKQAYEGAVDLMKYQTELLQDLATGLQAQPPGRRHRANVANLVTLVTHAILIMLGHAYGVAVLVRVEDTDKKGKHIKSGGVEEAAGSYHQAKDQAEEKPEDVQAQVEAVVAWTWLQQEVQKFQCQQWGPQAQGKYGEVVQRGSQHVQEWITKAM